MKFKTSKYWRQAFYDLYQACLRRSKVIRNIGDEFGVSVPVIRDYITSVLKVLKKQYAVRRKV